MGKLLSIFRFPIKSFAGEELDSAQISPSGLIGDRQLMLVDEAGRFITQREYPQLTQIQVQVKDNQLVLNDGSSKVIMDSNATLQKVREVKIWKFQVEVQEIDTEFNAVISERLGINVKLVKQRFSNNRIKKVSSQNIDLPLSFTDGYPIHIVNQASIDDLQEKLGKPLDRLRFRANLMIDGLKPYEEDGLTSIEGRNFKLHIVKPSSRCIIPNINPLNGQRDINVLGKLSEYRKNKSQVNFGIYAYSLERGEVLKSESLTFTF